MKYEIAIYGSGISAKIVSSLLARNDFKVCLISDKYKNKVSLKTNLVTFLSSGSLSYLSAMIPNMDIFDKYPEIQTINCQLDDLKANNVQKIGFSDNKKEALGKIIKNIDLEKYLDDDLQQFRNLDIIEDYPLEMFENTADGANLKFKNGKNILSELFILSSTNTNISKNLEIKFVKKDLERTALSISVEGNIKNKNCAFQKFTPDGPLAFLPYSDDEASIVWSLKNNSQILSTSNDELALIISNHLSDYISSLNIINIEKHKLQFTYSKNLFFQNTVLLGNIAHNIHPIAGQGLNLSIKDIVSFVNQITKYKSLGYKLNDQFILEEFEIKRKLDNTAYSFGTFSLDSILSSNSKILNFATRKGLGFVEKNKYLKQLFIRSATGKDFFSSF